MQKLKHTKTKFGLTLRIISKYVTSTTIICKRSSHNSKSSKVVVKVIEKLLRISIYSSRIKTECFPGLLFRTFINFVISSFHPLAIFNFIIISRSLFSLFFSHTIIKYILNKTISIIKIQYFELNFDD